MTNDEFKTEALRIIKELMDGLDYADDYAHNRDGFTIFNNDSSDAYYDGEQFLKTHKN
jgi:hypothetical protein